MTGQRRRLEATSTRLCGCHVRSTWRRRPLVEHPHTPGALNTHLHLVLLSTKFPCFCLDLGGALDICTYPSRHGEGEVRTLVLLPVFALQPQHHSASAFSPSAPDAYSALIPPCSTSRSPSLSSLHHGPRVYSWCVSLPCLSCRPSRVYSWWPGIVVSFLFFLAVIISIAPQDGEYFLQTSRMT